MSKIYIILLNHNGWKDTIECLESVLKSDDKNYQIIVVDNYSPNNSMEKIIDWAEGQQEVIYDENSQLKHLSQPFEEKSIDYLYYSKEEALNGGFAAGNNIGIKYALIKDNFEYIWPLNPDTVILPDMLTKLVSYAEHQSINIAIIGTSMFFRKEIIEDIGLFEEKYFIYYEEIDYALRAKKADYHLGLNLESIVYHKEGTSINNEIVNHNISDFSDLYVMSNRLFFTKKVESQYLPFGQRNYGK